MAQANPTPADLLMGMVDARFEAQAHPPVAVRDFKTRVTVAVAPDVYEAAAAREMSVSAYMRRSLLAFVAFDRDLDLYELLRNEPATRLNNASPALDKSEDGQGHGLWRIGSLY